MEKLAAATREELQGAGEVGPKVAEALFVFFREPHNQALLERLKAANLSFQYAKKKEGGPLTGMTFVITGTLPHLSREEAKEKIESNGGKVAAAVSRKTSYVLAGSDAGSKLDKARTLNIRIIGEGDLFALIAGNL